MDDMGMVAFSCGEFPVYWYGLLVSLAIALGWIVTEAHLYIRRERLGFLPDILLCSVVGGVAGARLGYVCLHFFERQWGFYDIAALNRGGFSVYGAFVGFFCLLALYTYWRDVRFWRCVDILTPAFLLGLAVLQMGNFALQATVGVPVGGSEASGSRIVEYIEYFFRPAGYEGYEYFWPVALYQAVWQFIVFCLAGALSFRPPQRGFREGDLFLLSLLLVCLGRIFFGFFYLGSGGGLSLGQGTCALASVGCVALMVKNRFVFRREIKGGIFH